MDNATNTEVFKDIPHYEGRYQISNKGTVWSVLKDRKLKPGKSSSGYLKVTLTDKYGKMKQESVHRLVALAFIPNPDKLPCVNHIDENKTNNDVRNLEWCSYKYNNGYGTKAERISQSRRNIGREVAQYDMKGRLIRVFNSVTDAAEEMAKTLTNKTFNQIRSCISSCLTEQNRISSMGYVWKYA